MERPWVARRRFTNKYQYSPWLCSRYAALIIFLRFPEKLPKARNFRVSHNQVICVYFIHTIWESSLSSSPRHWGEKKCIRVVSFWLCSRKNHHEWTFSVFFRILRSIVFLYDRSSFQSSFRDVACSRLNAFLAFCTFSPFLLDDPFFRTRLTRKPIFQVAA